MKKDASTQTETFPDSSFSSFDTDTESSHEYSINSPSYLDQYKETSNKRRRTEDVELLD
jgi:hypothetical protein